jgi:hypothetical protein
MTPAVPAKPPMSYRSAVNLTETLLHMVLSAAIPISAVVFVVLSL